MGDGITGAVVPGRHRREKKLVDSERMVDFRSLNGEDEGDGDEDAEAIDARKTASFWSKRTGEWTGVSSSVAFHEPRKRFMFNVLNEKKWERKWRWKCE